MKIRALEVLDRFIQFKPATVLDVGSGEAPDAGYMRSKEIEVTTVDKYCDADFKTDYLSRKFLPRHGIWCSHVLEHCYNVHEILLKFKDELRLNGVLSITVPPLRSKLVGGHLNNFTPGTLIYNLILAGFDCHNAIVYVGDPTQISIIVKNVVSFVPNNLVSGPGDLEKLSRFFPCKVFQAINGEFNNINWNNK